MKAPAQNAKKSQQPDASKAPAPNKGEQKSQQPDASKAPAPNKGEQKSQQPDASKAPAPNKGEQKSQQPDASKAPAPNKGEQKSQQPDASKAPAPNKSEPGTKKAAAGEPQTAKQQLINKSALHTSSSTSLTTTALPLSTISPTASLQLQNYHTESPDGLAAADDDNTASNYQVRHVNVFRMSQEELDQHFRPMQNSTPTPTRGPLMELLPEGASRSAPDPRDMTAATAVDPRTLNRTGDTSSGKQTRKSKPSG